LKKSLGLVAIGAVIFGVDQNGFHGGAFFGSGYDFLKYTIL
jgi:energy-converting hydrogenase Eha subunit G